MQNKYHNEGELAQSDTFFACPECLTPLGSGENGPLFCPHCQLQWPEEDGIHNFKEPIS